MKIAVITSICGNREKLQNPVVIFKDVDYIAFVDEQTPGLIWKQIQPYHFSSDAKYANRRNAKIYKILPELFLPEYDVFFWVDASHDLVINPHEYIDQLVSDEHPYANFVHTQRKCIYKEAHILKELGYDYPELIDSEMQYFKSKGYPENNGLYELSAFIKKKTHLSTIASLKWWEYICKYASRDQISFPFVLWETGIVPNILPGYANGFNAHGMIGNNPIMPQTRHHVSSGG